MVSSKPTKALWREAVVAGGSVAADREAGDQPDVFICDLVVVEPALRASEAGVH